MIRMPFVWLFAAVSLSAQTPLSVAVATEAARCEAISTNSICLAYAAPAPPAEGEIAAAGVFAPGSASFRITGPDQQQASVHAIVFSPAGRPWLQLRRIGETADSNTITGQLPLDLEVFADETQLSGVKAGRFVAMLVISGSGASAAVKVPVQLTVTAETDAIRAQPDSIPALIVRASPSAAPMRFSIGVGRREVDPPVLISVTPETSDGGNWLSADLRMSAPQCVDQPVPATSRLS